MNKKLGYGMFLKRSKKPWFCNSKKNGIFFDSLPYFLPGFAFHGEANPM